MKILSLLIFVVLYFSPSEAKEKNNNWQNIVVEGINKNVNFHAWGGSKNINQYIQWVASKVKDKYRINLKHIKIKDTAQVVKKVLYDKISQKNENGSVDIIWINGENFSLMKQNNLLYKKNWIFNLPNSKNLSLEKNSPLLYDFGVYTEGKEMPWGLSQFIYFYDSNKILIPPKSAKSLRKYILKNPGRITFPQPPDFVGTSFLKQILSELTFEKSLLREKFNMQKHEKILNRLWHWLDDVTPYLWKKGKHYPKNYLALSQLLADYEIDLAMAFNISFPSNEVLKGNLPPTIRSYVPNQGSLSNVHYLTIPYNAKNPKASKLVINFMISPEAQFHKQDPSIWGDPTVLSLNLLKQNWQDRFKNISKTQSSVPLSDLERKISEPHPSWVKEIEKIWIEKFGSSN